MKIKNKNKGYSLIEIILYIALLSMILIVLVTLFQEIVYVYTDGVTEAMSPQKTLFGKKRFLRLLEEPAPTASKLIDQIKQALAHHIDHAPQFDDITMLALHRKTN